MYSASVAYFFFLYIVIELHLKNIHKMLLYSSMSKRFKNAFIILSMDFHLYFFIDVIILLNLLMIILVS